MNRQEGSVIPVVMALLLAALVLGLFMVPKPGKPAPFYIEYSNHWEWVHSYEEKDGCIYWNGGKACGSYVIKDYRDQYKR